jgi:hypothetical protein
MKLADGKAYAAQGTAATPAPTDKDSVQAADLRTQVLRTLDERGASPAALADLIVRSPPHVAEVVAILHEVVGNRAVSKADEVLQARTEAAAVGSAATTVASPVTKASKNASPSPHAAPAQTDRAAASPEGGSSEHGVAERWRENTALANARSLPDDGVTSELGAVRQELAKQSESAGARTDAFDALRTAQQELEFEARRRGGPGGPDGVVGPVGSLDPMAQTGRLSATDEQSGRSPGADTARAVALRKLDYAIATMGLDGAERELQRLETEGTAMAEEGMGSHAVAEPMTWLRYELAQRRAEGAAFLERFELVGRSIALGMLGESASRLKSELARYGLRSGQAQSDGSLRGMGLARGERGDAIGDAVTQGKAIRAAYDRARAAGAGPSAWEDFEATKAHAIAAHPILASFIAGDTELAKAAPTGMVPNAIELGAQSPELLGAMVGWELNQKLVDNRTTTTNLESGKLSIFGAPRVVELTKLQMRVADGMMLSGVVDERVKHPPGAPWTDHLTSAIAVALGLMLAVPTGGASAGIAMAGNLALLASDLYLIGKDSAERSIPGAAANTDVLLERSLIDEEPAAAPLLTQLLAGIGLTAGVTGVMQGAAHIRELAQARQGITEIRTLRRTLADHGGDAMNPAVQSAADRLRATAQRAGLPPEKTEAMIRTALRNGADSRLAFNVSSGGVRGELPLTDAQWAEVDEYLRNFDLDGVAIRRVDETNLNTGYAHGDLFSILNIGSDVAPGNAGLGTLTANSRIGIRGTLAHEIVGHREAALAGRTQAIGAIEEAQASIRAARFAPDLTYTERLTLLRDGITRLHNAGMRIRNLRKLMHINER